ncbi:terminase small subunit [Carnobacterium inhibens]|uniref:terminase small subunit n=1 Tax=Carnobacterium inhibens TaxID=147709 RepID=UPI003D9ED61E
MRVGVDDYEYILSGNAIKATIIAGYSKKYANTNVSKLLQNTTIKTYIEEWLKEIDSEKIANQAEVL